MNTVQNFYNQQFGFKKWDQYDNVLRRLRCTRDEEFKGIWGEDDSSESEGATPIFACKFAQKQGSENLLALANEDGQLVVHDTNKVEPRQGKQIHHNAIFDISWLSDSLKLVTVSGDHTARLIDVGGGDMRTEQMFTGHSRSVKTIAVKTNDSSIFATGSRDGSIRVWDTRSIQASNLIAASDRVIQHSHCKTTPTTWKKRLNYSSSSVSAANSVTGLVFQNDNTLISCGSGDGLIKVWDLRKTYTTLKHQPSAKHEIPYSGSTTRNGFSNLILDPSTLKLYVNCLDNTIYCYNVATYNTQPVMEYKGFQNSTFYIKSVLSDDGKYLLSGSSDQTAYIWKINQSEPIIKLSGHTAEVTCVAWGKDTKALVTCSDDVRHKIWRIGNEYPPDNWEVIGRGYAESVAKSPINCKRFIEENENTPSQPKRFRYSSSSKRKLDVDDGGNSAKRFNSGRRLFDATNSVASCSTVDDGPLATILESMNKTPPTNGRKRLLVSTPPEVFSPTTNLPNFAIDGEAPHLHCSPQKKQDCDWLTKMRVERSFLRQNRELVNSGAPPLKVPRLISESSPRGSSRQPKRRKSKCDSPQTRIVEYFRATSNSIMKDGQCSPRSSLSQTTQNLTNRSNNN
ncbi:PREDICTED: protein lethal(2)denticleless [Nicrophorus vespilloides]|uniref:Protein lethal(2)denticleless n=1 Tax=Nicrophorus vespilloides TaxID=110193 RepID=A0ABM1MZG0_NICVS|nr:PREDICTED: protein lethal(2)denticleless [Nicrophorus vespilloides]